MSYASLADEMILQIINRMPPSSLENFARINRRTYRISLPLLEPTQALKRNAKFITARFGKDMKPFNSICRGHRSKPLYTSLAILHFDYLNLNGDLHWLQPLDEETMATYRNWPQGEGIPQERLDALIESGKRVNIEFPKPFLTFMASTELMSRMCLGGDYFFLGPHLVKCNAEDDNNGGGYMINFLADQQSCRFWALYVAPGGYHCVLNTPSEVCCWKCSDTGPYGGPPIVWDDHPKYEVYEGIPVACEKIESSLAHTNFEAWLAMNYFDGLGTGESWMARKKMYIEHLKKAELH